MQPGSYAVPVTILSIGAAIMLAAYATGIMW